MKALMGVDGKVSSKLSGSWLIKMHLDRIFIISRLYLSLSLSVWSCSSFSFSFSSIMALATFHRFRFVCSGLVRMLGACVHPQR
jgi:hypothetical protein